MIDAVIFDVDGTLVDSVVHEIVAWHEALTRRNFHVSRDAVRAQMGKGGDRLLETLLPDQPRWERDRVKELQGTIFRAQHRSEIRPFPMVAPLFARLRADGSRIALGSSGDREDIRHYQRLTRTEQLVDVVACMDDVCKSKPSPEIFQRALQRLHVPPACAVAVGDTIYDAEAASRLGMRTVGVLGGAFTREALLDAGCVAVYRDVADLYERFATSLFAAPALAAP